MRILVFSPYSALWNDSLIESQFIKLLRNNYAVSDIYYLRCGSSFENYCPPREYLLGGIENKNEFKACRTCSVNDNILSLFNKSKNKKLSDYLTTSDYLAANDFAESNFQTDPIDISIDGYEIGLQSCYEVLLKFKKKDHLFNSEERAIFKENIRNSFLVYSAAEKILSDIKPDLVIMSQPQYSAQGIFADFCFRRNIPVYKLGGNPAVSEMYSSVVTWNWNETKRFPYFGERQYVENQCNQDDLQRAIQHFQNLSNKDSMWNYSPLRKGNSTRRTFRIPVETKIYLVASNSQDEVFALETLTKTKSSNSVFANQIEWLKFMLKYAAENPTNHFIFRPHPREFPNKREDETSPNTAIYKTLFSSIPTNVSIDWPHLNFSIYDHYEEISGLITGWSSVGLDAIFRNIPVVTYDEALPHYPKFVHHTGNSLDDFKRNLDDLLDGNLYAKKIEMLEWFAKSVFTPSVRVGGPANFRIKKEALKRLYLSSHPRLQKLYDVAFRPTQKDFTKIGWLIPQLRRK